MKASSLYRAELWRLGLGLARHLPQRLGDGLACSVASGYWAFQVRRRRIVIENLRPVLPDNRGVAFRASRALFLEFGRKILDLLRFESGSAIGSFVKQWSAWELFQAAQSRGRGVLMVTPHLGNWEFGAPLLVERGVRLCVITMVEPDPRLTELRRKTRALRGVETVVIGADPFAFVEIIRQLESGATVAILIDRPPANSAVQVEFFGRPFAASVAAAELARASGCAILPVYLPRIGDGYRAVILPEIGYDRASLRAQSARLALTQEILRAFEPVVRQYLTQWYHFVPIWPSVH